MATTTDNIELDNLEVLRQVVRALELRFPNHNGPFEYCTRLAEETGELMEVAYKVKDGIVNNTHKQNLLKEMQDVSRVVFGIAELYNLADRLPSSFSEFDMNGDPKEILAYIVRLGVCSGELASAINHAEGVGVKKEKYGGESLEHVRKKTYAVAQVVAWMVSYFGCETEIEAQIAKAFIDYKEHGFI